MVERETEKREKMKERRKEETNLWSSRMKWEMWMVFDPCLAPSGVYILGNLEN